MKQSNLLYTEVYVVSTFYVLAAKCRRPFGRSGRDMLRCSLIPWHTCKGQLLIARPMNLPNCYNAFPNKEKAKDGMLPQHDDTWVPNKPTHACRVKGAHLWVHCLAVSSYLFLSFL